MAFPAVLKVGQRPGVIKERWLFESDKHLCGFRTGMFITFKKSSLSCFDSFLKSKVIQRVFAIIRSTDKL